MRNVESIEVGYGEALQFGVSQGTYYKEPEQLLTEAYEAGKRDAIPEGWVLVPKEPTEEMELRGAECTNSIDWGDCPADAPYDLASTVYAAMLAAAPKGEDHGSN